MFSHISLFIFIYTSTRPPRPIYQCHKTVKPMRSETKVPFLSLKTSVTINNLYWEVLLP